MNDHSQDALPQEPDAQWVSLWLDGRLSPEQEQRLLQAIEQDAQLAQLAQQWKQLRRQLRILPRCKLDEQFTQGVLAQIEQLAESSPSALSQRESAPQPASAKEEKHPAGEKPARRMPWEFWACVSTAVVAASLLLFWAWGGTSREDPLAMQEPSPRKVTAPSPEEIELAEIQEHQHPAESVEQDDPDAIPPIALEGAPVHAGKAGPPAKAPGRPALSSANSFSKHDVLSRAAGPRMKAPAASKLPIQGGAGAGALRANRAIQPQTIPWERLPVPLQNTLIQSQQADASDSAQVLVVQLGITPQALQRGWLHTQLAAVGQPLSQTKNRRALRHRKLQAQRSNDRSVPQEDKAKLQAEALQASQLAESKQETSAAVADQVVHLEVSREQLPQLLNRLARFQSPRGPVQYLSLGSLEPTEADLPARRKEFRETGRNQVPEKTVSSQKAFQGRAFGQQAESQQLVLHPLPLSRSLDGGMPRQAASAPARPPAAAFGTADQKPAADRTFAAQPVVQLWLVLEVRPTSSSRGKLPLVAPPPADAPSSR